ncbi:2-dehydro-3-deoxygalactonokinase [Primorskyibacter sp. S187A]|uniref:2-dehydro-3-deoxygalactonokinase n=1 Tax=Primorskyibacter sp. S187A TaxID=3415130 RepID=UPI003C7A1552
MQAEWIAVDWGTSHLRVWAMRGDTVLADASSDAGMGSLARAEFEQALLELIGPWLPAQDAPHGIQVLICGMAGARQGWAEAPYRAVPCAAEQDHAIHVQTRDNRIAAFILPGVKQESPADVMRGEETQIAGFIARNPDWDGTLVLPGSHCKWVQISAREIVSFRTALTGEMFAALSRNTVLRHSLGEGWDRAAFDDGVADGLARPEHLVTRLFSLRAEGLLHGLDPDAAKARLSGLLIGMELAATRPYWLGQQIALIGDTALTALYARALEAQGVPSAPQNATLLTLAGLSAARLSLKETLS